MRREKLMDFINVLLNEEPDLRMKYFDEISIISALIQNAKQYQLEKACDALE